MRTSRIRKNVLAEYLDPENYVEPVAFFKFLGNGKFRKLDEYDYDDQSLLTLTVLEHEVKSWLILGYDNGHVTKVSVEELMEYQPRDYARYADAKLIFASIANDIIPARYKHQFDGILDKIKSFVGYPQNTVTKPMVNALHLWGINEI